MKVLIACEESQRVCEAFRNKGHEAYSADIQKCSGGHPEWHILGDVIPILNGDCDIKLESGEIRHIYGNWDLIIAHPPCTDIAVSGARHFAKKREDGRQQRGIDFFMNFTRADCDRIAIENPVCIMSTIWRKPDQIIQPWMFGDPFEKKTCLWLKGLSKLKESNPVKPQERVKFNSGKTMPAWIAESFKLPKEERSRVRSKTFQGIADAMADQWG